MIKISTLSTIIFFSLLFPGFFLSPFSAHAQEPNNPDEAKKLTVTGYVQGQFDIGQEFATSKLSNSPSYNNERDGTSDHFFRFGVRRGRIILKSEESFGTVVLQTDFTEKGINLKDFYYKVSEPWLKLASLSVGIFDLPFGFDISHSTFRRENAELPVIYQELFPDDKDVGTMLTISVPKESKWYGLQLNAGFFCGNAVATPDNGDMDFCGRIKYNKKWSNVSFGIGSSFYFGTVRNTDVSLFQVKDGKWEQTTVEKNLKNARQYVGFDTQLSVQTSWGITTLRGEILSGSQPSTAGKLRSPNKDLMPYGATPFNHIRRFSSWYFYCIQDVGQTPLSVVLRYVYLDPNTKIKSEEITQKTDLSYRYLGAGFMVRCNAAMRLMCYYDLPFNSTDNRIPVSEAPATGKNHVANYQKHMKEGLFTCRLQYRF